MFICALFAQLMNSSVILALHFGEHYNIIMLHIPVQTLYDVLTLQGIAFKFTRSL